MREQLLDAGTASAAGEIGGIVLRDGGMLFGFEYYATLGDAADKSVDRAAPNSGLTQLSREIDCGTVVLHDAASHIVRKVATTTVCRLEHVPDNQAADTASGGLTIMQIVHRG